MALVLGLGPQLGHGPPLVVGVELELQADGVLDAANETLARVGLFFHGPTLLSLTEKDVGFMILSSSSIEI
jgi:hypothetical protein